MLCSGLYFDSHKGIIATIRFEHTWFVDIHNREKELEPNSVVKDSLTTATDGKKYYTKYYNLDVNLSVGYRVKSKQGTQSTNG